MAKEVIERSVAELIPYDRNPNVHPDSQIEQLANSIRQWGWTIPILIDETDMVIAGHGRLYAAQKLGMDKVPCIKVEGWTDEQKRAYVIADNQLAAGSEWNTALYVQELREIAEAGFDLEPFGMDLDFGGMDYAPNLEPTADTRLVGADDIDRAGAGMTGEIDRIAGKQREEGVDVMCPYCAESFKFTGV